jgi:hypothetical protein
MFERIVRGWRIMKASGGVLARHPKLVVFPLLSLVALAGLVAAIVIPVAASPQFAATEEIFDSVRADEPLLYIALFALYFVLTLIVVFLNAALVFCALESFAGRKPSLRGGLSAAVGRLPQILAWTFLSTTVGLLLNALQGILRDKLGFLGSILGGIAEFAWAVITYFVVPLLVVEGVGPVTAVKRSASIIKKTWGESLVGEAGLFSLAFLLMIPAIFVAGLAATVGRSLGLDWVIVAGVLGVVIPYILVLMLVFGAMGVIFQTGVYVYATTGKPPGSMDPALLQSAFRRK